MTRIHLHRNEYERGWPRYLMMGLIVLMMGFFSAILVGLVAAETHSGTFAPLAQNRAADWDPEQWSREAPTALALVGLSVLSALAVGVHSLEHGGILGFLVSLFNLIPFAASGGASPATAFRASPFIWGAFLAGSLLAFYAGDAGSWLCRRRLRREVAEDALRSLAGDDEAPRA